MATKLKSANTVSAVAELNLHTAEALFYVNEALYEAMQEIVGFEVVATAKEMCPVLPLPTKERVPGELRDSIDATIRRDKKGVRARITTASGYGGYVELGTKKMMREPYLWPAFEANISKLPDAVRERLTEFVSEEKI
jgi:HK97 gp10 family phage protein